MRRRRRKMGLLEKIYLVAILGLLVGGSVWLDRNGTAVTARVKEKHERIAVLHEPSGAWRRHWDVGVEFAMPNGGTMPAAIAVPRERWDSLRVGDPLEIRYLPALPVLARTTDRSTAGIAWSILVGLAEIPILLWLVGGLAALWIASRVGKVLVIATGAAWTAAAFPLLFSTPSPAPPAGVEATARVGAVTTVSKSPSRKARRRRVMRRSNTDAVRRLAIPYQVVELVVPTRSGDSVIAVDAIDSGSVALTFGDTVPVRLDPAAPREARLATGTRLFVDRNRYHFLPAVLGFGLLGTLASLLFRRKRRDTNGATDGAGSPRGD